MHPTVRTMSSYNQLQKIYEQFGEYHPDHSAILSNVSLTTLSFITIICLMMTLAFNVKTSSIATSAINFAAYTVLAAISALLISFTILFVSSHVGVHT